LLYALYFLRQETFRVNSSTHQKLSQRKRRLARRLADRRWTNQARVMLAARNISYELAERDRAVTCGGLGVMHLLAQRVGLPQALDRHLHLLKRHLPYHESDHVLSLAYNILADGTCLEDLEHLRTNEALLDALGAQRLPDPTTAGDFCRRFETDAQVLTLMETLNEVRLKVWQQQEPSFFAEAVIEADGTIAPTTGECKEGMNISYDGQWGYHPLLISLANTKEPLYLVNRSANRPSHEQADGYLDKAIALCRRAGFGHMVLRGDTDFMQTWKLDAWDQMGDVHFYFGADAKRSLIARAQALPAPAWQRLERAPKYEVQTQERAKPPNVKEQVVRAKGFTNFVLQGEEVAEFAHRPDLCRQPYRMVVLRKLIAVEKGQERLFEEYRYFFYITNDRTSPAAQIVLQCNDRCDQENLIAQLKNGVRSMRNPLDNLHSNWAYMVMASLAWTLKAWCGLLLPVQPGRYQTRHEQQKRTLVRMEFKGFLQALIRLPCQIVRTGRRIVYRLLSWNPWTGALLRLAEALHRPLRC
jgi:hypothetical protein